MRRLSRRDVLRAGVSWLALAGGDVLPLARLHAGQTSLGRAARPLRLTAAGGDRATGYVMSNKIARRGGRFVCTWLDVQRQNQWALVDAAEGRILGGGPVGPPRTDNHCGAALATDVDGTLHLLVGAHHASFIHFCMPPDKESWLPVEDGQAVGASGTYPSLVCDRAGTLHVTYRRETKGRDAHLMYCRRPAGAKWSEPRPLVRLAVSEHSWLTNAVETGPEGRLHAVFSNTVPVPAQGSDARYYGASHLYSDDAGETWRQLGGTAPLTPAADAAQLARIESSGLPPQRVEEHYGGDRGPRHSYYHKMVLSNPAIDPQGRPWVIVHNLLAGDAQLFGHDAERGWTGTALGTAVSALLPGHRIRHCGQLSRQGDGSLQAVLMVSPADGPGWGDPGTSLVRLVFGPSGRIAQQELVHPPEPGLPDWLPSLERWCPHAPVERPALLYTRGVNAGGYSNNVNSIKTEVWLDPR